MASNIFIGIGIATTVVAIIALIVFIIKTIEFMQDQKHDNKRYTETRSTVHEHVRQFKDIERALKELYLLNGNKILKDTKEYVEQVAQTHKQHKSVNSQLVSLKIDLKDLEAALDCLRQDKETDYNIVRRYLMKTHRDIEQLNEIILSVKYTKSKSKGE